MRKLSLRLWLAIVFLSGFANRGETQAGNPTPARPTRIVTGLPSPARLLGELEWLVADLAGEPKTWNEQVAPSFDIFLIGVDTERPLGLDFVFDRTAGFRYQWQVPLENLNDFRTENLLPIDIESRRAGADRTLYNLDAPALGYKGFMRIVDNYASISEQREDVPADMPSPRMALDAMLAPQAYSAGISARNDAAGIEDRRETFATIRDEALAGVTRRPTETKEAFELRQTLARHQFRRMERLFVEAESLSAGWITDKSQRNARGELSLTALPGTDLAAVVADLGAAASYFAAVPAADAAVVSGRINMAVDDKLQTQIDEACKLLNPVWKQRIDAEKDLTAAQKTAWKQIIDLALDMIGDVRDIRVVDACIEITPTADTLHQFVGGIRTSDGDKAVEILKHLPAAMEDMAFEANIETVGDVAIHRLKSTGKIPEALSSFYGGSGEVYLATCKAAVWAAGGPEALTLLKETISKAQAEPGEPNGDVVVGKIKLGPVLKNLDDLAVETGFDLNKFLGRDSTAAEPSSRASGSSSLLAGLDMRSIVLPVLTRSADDVFTGRIRQQEGVIHAECHVQVGILQAAGKVIARVAAERLKN